MPAFSFFPLSATELVLVFQGESVIEPDLLRVKLDDSLTDLALQDGDFSVSTQIGEGADAENLELTIDGVKYVGLILKLAEPFGGGQFVEALKGNQVLGSLVIPAPPATPKGILKTSDTTLLIFFHDELSESLGDGDLTSLLGRLSAFSANGQSLPITSSSYNGSNWVSLGFGQPIPDNFSIIYDPDGDIFGAGRLQSRFEDPVQSFTLTQNDLVGYSTLALLSNTDGTNFRSYLDRLISGAGDLLTAVDFASFIGFGDDLNIGLSPLQGFNNFAIGNAITLPSGGFFLTTGGGPFSLANTTEDYQLDRGLPGNTILDQFALEAFPELATKVGDNEQITYDASILSLGLNLDANARTLLVDVVFASDEYPEFANTAYVDIASVWVGDPATFDNEPVNYGNFGGDKSKPLSIIRNSLADPRFLNNNPFPDLYSQIFADRLSPYAPLPIEFDGISKVLTLAIPVSNYNLESLRLNFGIADTGDAIYDSALFISNIRVLADGFGEVRGALFAETVSAGATFVAAPTAPVYVTVDASSAGAAVTTTSFPDVLVIEGKEPVVLRGLPEQIKDDVIFGFAEGSIVELVTDQAPRVEIRQGSAIIDLFFGGSNQPTSFTLKGSYDINNFTTSFVDDKFYLGYGNTILPVPAADPIINATAFADLAPSQRAAILAVSSLKNVVSVVAVDHQPVQELALAPVAFGFNRKTSLLVLDPVIYKVSQINFKSVKNSRALDKQLNGLSNFVFDRSTGALFFDANGPLPGFGDSGGIVAILDGLSKLSPLNLVLSELTL